MHIGNFSAWMHKKWLKHVLVITFIKLLHLTCEKTFQFHFHTSFIVKSTWTFSTNSWGGKTLICCFVLRRVHRRVANFVVSSVTRRCSAVTENSCIREWNWWEQWDSSETISETMLKCSVEFRGNCRFWWFIPVARINVCDVRRCKSGTV